MILTCNDCDGKGLDPYGHGESCLSCGGCGKRCSECGGPGEDDECCEENDQ